MGPPFGEVRAGVGYDYDQWLHLYGIARRGARLDQEQRAGHAARPGTRSLPGGACGRPRSGPRGTPPPDRFLLLRPGRATATPGCRRTTSPTDAGSGARGSRPGTGDGEPVATTFLDDGSVLTALPGGKDGTVRLTRLAGDTGQVLWTRDLRHGRPGRLPRPASPTDLVVVGGSEEYRLADPSPRRPGGPVLTGLRAQRRAAPRGPGGADPGSLVHVVGVAGRAAGRWCERSAAGAPAVLALDDAGEQELVDRPAGRRLRGDPARRRVVLVDSRRRLGCLRRRDRRAALAPRRADRPHVLPLRLHPGPDAAPGRHPPADADHHRPARARRPRRQPAGATRCRSTG